MTPYSDENWRAVGSSVGDVAEVPGTDVVSQLCLPLGATRSLRS